MEEFLHVVEHSRAHGPIAGRAGRRHRGAAWIREHPIHDGLLVEHKGMVDRNRDDVVAGEHGHAVVVVVAFEPAHEADHVVHGDAVAAKNPQFGAAVKLAWHGWCAVGIRGVGEEFLVGAWVAWIPRKARIPGHGLEEAHLRVRAAGGSRYPTCEDGCKDDGTHNAILAVVRKSLYYPQEGPIASQEARKA